MQIKHCLFFFALTLLIQTVSARSEKILLCSDSENCFEIVDITDEFTIYIKVDNKIVIHPWEKIEYFLIGSNKYDFIELDNLKRDFIQHQQSASVFLTCLMLNIDRNTYKKLNLYALRHYFSNIQIINAGLIGLCFRGSMNMLEKDLGYMQIPLQTPT